VKRKLLWLAGAAGAIAAASTSCGAGGDNKLHGVDAGDAKAVAGAYVLDLLRCTDASLRRQADYLARRPKDLDGYVLQMKTVCKPRGLAKLQQQVVQSSGKTRVVDVRYVTGSGSGSTRVHLADTGDGYRVTGPFTFTRITTTPAS
jgi:hypothetical protein